MNKQIEALKLAEEALQLYRPMSLPIKITKVDKQREDVIAAIRAALAEPVKQEPVGVVNTRGGINWRLGQKPLPPRTHLYAAPVYAKTIRAEAFGEAALVARDWHSNGVPRTGLYEEIMRMK